MRLIFMGTPDFARENLAELHQSSHEVLAVVTAPDKPAGRGRKPRASAVKKYALRHNLPLYQPEKLRDPNFLSAMERFKPDVIIVVAFRMLPQVLWSIPLRGTINLHASLLPDYRGAAPINWAIINGEKVTGVTTFLINEAIDTGGILMQEAVPIKPDDDAGVLHDRLLERGKRLLLETLNKLDKGELEAQPQKEQAAKHKAPKIFKKDQKLNFERPAIEVHNLIRGMHPYPGAFCTLVDQERDLLLKINRSEVSDQPVEKNEAGRVRIENGKLQVACADKWLIVLELQPAGKKRMTASAWLNGISLSDKARFN